MERMTKKTELEQKEGTSDVENVSERLSVRVRRRDDSTSRQLA